MQTLSSYKHLKHSVSQVLFLSPFYRWGSWASQKSENIPQGHVANGQFSVSKIHY